MKEVRIRNYIFLIFAFSAIFIALKVFAADQMKTTQTFVGDSGSAVSGTTLNKTFNLYIGDNISGVNNAVKSAFFTVSGVYTGGGETLDFTINSDNNTRKQFYLPSVSSPTHFEILYKDPINKINPTTGGSFQYTLNIIVPASTTIYGLGAKLTTTYRYIPNVCQDGQPANEKIKSVQSFVGSSTVAISSQIDKIFSIFIGDNINGVSNPVKSVYFTVSGFYTGGVGILLLRINSDISTSKAFSFPVVTKPTFFEILYKDPANTINPSTAGNYSYTLNIIPSGITIYGFGAKATTTYRYKPPTCGGVTTGELVSAVFETTAISDGPAFNSIMWKGTLGSGKVRLKIATSDSSSGPWEFRGPDPDCSLLSSSDTDWYVVAPDVPLEIGCISYHNNKRYFKYKIQLCMASNCTTTGATSPTVEDVIVNWSP